MSNRVALVCNYSLHPNRIGGMDRFFVAFDQKLKQENFEITWFFTDYEAFDFYKNLNIKSNSKIDVTDCFLKDLADNTRTYDVLITHFVALCIPFFKKVKQFGIQKTIAVDHNPRPLDGFSWSKVIKNKIKGLLYSPYIDQFVGVSDYTKKHILKDYGSFLNGKTSLIFNGIDVEIFDKRNAENFGKFIVSSHLRPAKGIQDLIQAVSMLPTELLKLIHIDVFGEGPMESELKQMVLQKNLQEVIIFKGSVSNLHQLYKDYSFLIHPSHGETYCYSIFESLCANVPVITNIEAGNIVNIINDNKNGYLYSMKEIQKLTEILSDVLLKKRRLVDDFSAEISQKYSIDQMVENHFKYLQI